MECSGLQKTFTKQTSDASLHSKTYSTGSSLVALLCKIIFSRGSARETVTTCSKVMYNNISSFKIFIGGSCHERRENSRKLWGGKCDKFLWWWKWSVEWWSWPQSMLFATCNKFFEPKGATMGYILLSKISDSPSQVLHLRIFAKIDCGSAGSGLKVCSYRKPLCDLIFIILWSCGRM